MDTTIVFSDEQFSLLGALVIREQERCATDLVEAQDNVAKYPGDQGFLDYLEYCIRQSARIAEFSGVVWPRYEVSVMAEIKRGRGRPSTGEGKTNAERQKAYRERRRAEGKQVVTLLLPSESVQGLKQFTRFKDITPGSVVGKLVQGQLLRKRSGAKR